MMKSKAVENTIQASTWGSRIFLANPPAQSLVTFCDECVQTLPKHLIIKNKYRYLLNNGTSSQWFHIFTWGEEKKSESEDKFILDDGMFFFFFFNLVFMCESWSSPCCQIASYYIQGNIFFFFNVIKENNFNAQG